MSENSHKMSDEEIEAFVRPNPKAYARFKKAKRKKKLNNFAAKFKKIWNAISNAILWFCAVGGFLLSLLQFLQDK